MHVMKRPKGIHCPVCMKAAKCAYWRSRPLFGVRVRYFKCECGARFHTTERLNPPAQK